MINLLRALDLWRIVWEILVDVEVKVERAAFVHALVGLYCEDEIEDIVGIGERGFHGRAQGEFGEICRMLNGASAVFSIFQGNIYGLAIDHTFLHPQLGSRDFLLLAASGRSVFSLLLLLLLREKQVSGKKTYIATMNGITMDHIFNILTATRSFSLEKLEIVRLGFRAAPGLGLAFDGNASCNWKT